MTTLDSTVTFFGAALIDVAIAVIVVLFLLFLGWLYGGMQK